METVIEGLEGIETLETQLWQVDSINLWQEQEIFKMSLLSRKDVGNEISSKSGVKTISSR